MPSFTRTITVRREPEQVFAVLDDLQQAKQWMPSIRRIDVLTPGMRMGVGFKWRETRRVLGIFRMSVVLVVTAYERPKTWGLTFHDKKLQAVATFELAPKPWGTEVTFVEEAEDLQGKPQRAERMLKMMEKQDGDLLERLKAHLEATTQEPSGLAAEPAVEAPAAARPGAKPKSKPKAPRKAAKTSAKSAKPAKTSRKKR